MFRERFSVFASLFLSVVSLAFASSAFHTDFWILSDVMRRNGTESNKNQMNSGLFHGIRQLDWAFGPKRKHFSVLDELQSGVSFIDRNVWFALLLSIGLGFLWNIVGLSVTVKNCTKYGNGGKKIMPDVGTVIVGPLAICFWGTLTTVSYGICAALFLWQFFIRFRHNVLLSEHISAGFSSEGCVRLGFSFWLLISAVLAQFAPCVLLFWALKGRKKQTNEEQKSKEQDTVFLY
ncbi:hypothetical protein niasHT_015342 [Heterodera trifolii]|uniref:Uncharacterized protein n=1 Tax=Heterodera trifolii TaxID=157864 RepID=A0ABD2KZM1_9BILA